MLIDAKFSHKFTFRRPGTELAVELVNGSFDKDPKHPQILFALGELVRRSSFVARRLLYSSSLTSPLDYSSLGTVTAMPAA